MKNIIKISLVCLTLVFALSSCCDDVVDGKVKQTDYATFTLNGGDVTKVAVGTTYEDPGCICTEGSTDITSSVETVGIEDINTSKPGVYTVTYSAKNVDGFASSATRTVIVYDEASTERNIEGTYTVQGGSYRLREDAKVAYSGYDIDITYIAPGLYSISDYLGGYYDQRAGYGSDYACTGYFWLKNDNTIEALTADVAGWGDSADGVEAKLNDDGSITMATDYASMTFYVTLAK